jgi:hypothetical protein
MGFLGVAAAGVSKGGLSISNANNYELAKRYQKYGGKRGS